jgi:hypothetical protein
MKTLFMTTAAILAIVLALAPMAEQRSERCQRAAGSLPDHKKGAKSPSSWCASSMPKHALTFVSPCNSMCLTRVSQPNVVNKKFTQTQQILSAALSVCLMIQGIQSKTAKLASSKDNVEESHGFSCKF